MRIEPKLDEIVNGKRGMLRGIQVCIENECLVSAVSLLFGAIDALSALTRAIDRDETNHKVFKEWVSKYVLQDPDLDLTAEDLYGARCGVLHTYGSDSRSAREGYARQIIYRWRIGPDADEQKPLPTNAVKVEIEALWDAFRKGVGLFLIDSEMDDEVREKVQYHLKSLLCYTPWPQLRVHVAA